MEAKFNDLESEKQDILDEKDVWIEKQDKAKHYSKFIRKKFENYNRKLTRISKIQKRGYVPVIFGGKAEADKWLNNV